MSDPVIADKLVSTIKLSHIERDPVFHTLSVANTFQLYVPGLVPRGVRIWEVVGAAIEA
jgi:hypothetical protein